MGKIEKDNRLFQNKLLLSIKKLRIITELRFWKKWWPVALVVVYITVLFIYGYFFDKSHSIDGSGWADQDLYKATVDNLIQFKLPTVGQLHFAIGYPLLGVFGYLFSPNHPFAVVSYMLMLSSALFCFSAAKKLIGRNWALFFVFLTFVFYLGIKSIQYAPEVFFVPWNNQVLFFAFSFFFWLLVTQTQKNRPALYVLASVVSGVSIMTREESVIFVVPLLIAYLYLTKVNWKKLLVCAVILLISLAPQAIVKQKVLGSATRGGNDRSYGTVSEKYLKPSLFVRNMKEVVVYSGRDENVRRPALLQAAPWLLISPFGFLLILLGRKWPLGLKIFVVISAGLFIFYISGANMSAKKLKFNCLRYIAPSFIMLNFTTVVAIKETSYFIKSYNKKSA